MTDKELLQLAAKAAGYKLKYSHKKNGFFFNYGQASEREWNPLENDGDALRLAVVVLPFHVLSYTREDYDHCNKNGLAATRRFIVRAAAGDVK